METVTTSAQLVCEVEVRCDPGFYRNSDQKKDKGHVVVLMVTGYPVTANLSDKESTFGN